MLHAHHSSNDNKRLVHECALDAVLGSSLAGMIPCVIMCWLKGETLLLALGSVATCASALYHAGKEQSRLMHYIDMGSVLLTLLIHYAKQAYNPWRIGGWFWLVMDRTSLLGHAFAFMCWRLGCGRHSHKQRNWRYEVFHSAFHLVLGSVVVRELLFF
jgi:hypothetical protein